MNGDKLRVGVQVVMRYLIVLVVVLGWNVQAQDTLKRKHVKDFSGVERIWGLWTNFQQGRYPEVALGVSFSSVSWSRCAFGNGATTVSLAYQRALMGDMVEQGVSLSYYLHGFIPLSLGLQVGYKNRDQQHFFLTKPMLGFEIGRFLMAYSYSIPFHKRESYEGIPFSTHQLQLAFAIPVIRK